MTMPLAGKRILVTRPADQLSKLAALLAEQGAEPVLIPTIELAPPLSWCGLDAALTTLNAYDLLIFTSANAVRVFAQRARRLGIHPAARTIATIGPATREAVVEEGIAGLLLDPPQRSVAEGLVEQLVPTAAGKSMLLVRAQTARELLPQALVAAGAEVTIAVAYRTITPQGSIPLLRSAFEQGIDAVTFTSASTVQNLCALLEEAGLRLPEAAVLASIGPITSAAMRELGLTPTVQAAESTIAGLTKVLSEFFGSASPGG